MPGGLVALLDDVAALTRLAAASLDDVGAAAGRASTKALGVVIDDAAVTPRYVAGLAPQRELPMVARIALGSIRNKLLVLLPVSLLLSAFAPWALTPLLMVGGAYLCFEGAEKVIEAVSGGHAAAPEPVETASPQEVEDRTVSGAVRTDFILSAEIMALALNEVAASPLPTQAIVLAIVAVAITAGVYGAVGLIVKLDDIGLYLAGRGAAAVRALGRGMVKAMPVVMRVLTVVGTAAMIWVGGGILLHGLEVFGLTAPAHILHDAAHGVSEAAPAWASAILNWLVTAIGSGIIGMLVGGILAMLATRFLHPKPAAH